jgi:AcrR family transcriptional regulator
MLGTEAAGRSFRVTGPGAREQRTEERRRRILQAARDRAETDGWAAVTTRHLADAIGFSQPVLYGHFPGGKGQIVLAVAFEGFAELTQVCRTAVEGTRGRAAVVAVAAAYLEFGRTRPATYEAMFGQDIEARFASADSPAELRAAFEALGEAVGGDGSRTEVFWAALHGIHLLERGGRMRPEHRAERIAVLGALFGS